MMNKNEKKKKLNMAILAILGVFTAVALLFNSYSAKSYTMTDATEVNDIAKKYNIPKSTVEVISNNGGFTVEVPDYVDCKSEFQNVKYFTKVNGYEYNVYARKWGIKIQKNESSNPTSIYIPKLNNLDNLYNVTTYYINVSDQQSYESLAQFKISLTCISEEMLEKYDTLKEFDPEDVEIQIVGGWVNPYIDELSIYDTDIECEITSTTLSKDDPIHEVAASGQVTIEYSPKFGEIDTYSNVMNSYKPRMYKAFTPVKKTYYIKGTYHDDKYWREHRQMLLKEVAKGEKSLSEDDTKELLTMYNNNEVYSEEDIKGMSVSLAKKIYKLGNKVGVAPKTLAPECDLILLKPKAWNRFPLDTCYLNVSDGWATFFYSPFTIGGSGKKWGTFNGNKGSGYSGINFQVSTTKSFKKLKYNKHYGGDDEEHSFMLKGTKKGKTYYVRLRTYKKMANGRVYGTFSPVYKFKVKRNSYTTNAYQHDWETASDPSDCELLD